VLRAYILEEAPTFEIRVDELGFEEAIRLIPQMKPHPNGIMRTMEIKLRFHSADVAKHAARPGEPLTRWLRFCEGNETMQSIARTYEAIPEWVAFGATTGDHLKHLVEVAVSDHCSDRHAFDI